MKNFENFSIGTKIQSFDKDGYYVMNACGIVEKHLGGGHAIIKTFNGIFFSTVGQYKVSEIEAIN
jgi:hypothetical protein